VAPQSAHLYAYGPGDYRLVTLATSTQELTYPFRDLNGAVLREYTLTGSGAPEKWANWKHEKDFVYGPEGLLGSVTRTSTRYFSHKDHLGTPRAISDVAGVRRGRHDYYPFGHEIPRPNQVDEPTVKFTGHQRDVHGLSDYMLGRTCLWPLRRFASVDPARDGWNLYAYVGNNPINFVDPDGKESRVAIQIGQDERALLSGQMTAEEFTANIEARGAGALAAASVFIPGPEDVVLAGVAGVAAKTGGRALLKRVVGIVKKLFGKADDVPIPGGTPKPSPKFKTPTNPPQTPPTEIPPGWRVREMPN
jgi:RHS repeat-associated protein